MIKIPVGPRAYVLGRKKASACGGAALRGGEGTVAVAGQRVVQLDGFHMVSRGMWGVAEAPGGDGWVFSAAFLGRCGQNLTFSCNSSTRRRRQLIKLATLVLIVLQSST